MLRKKIDLEALKTEQRYDSKKVIGLRGKWFQNESYVKLLKLLR